ncbi:hypothetical protein F5Y17DRAFT_459068 [Xylariaceae sp. FL0594]|nr:hypothetical protein F5Y17DRAFT_459068 [Xylariaceae sp. FL0594]
MPAQSNQHANLPPYKEMDYGHNPPTEHPYPPGKDLGWLSFGVPPNRYLENSVLPVDKFIAFNELWRKEDNFTGRLYDVLYDKACKFALLCHRLGITEDQYYAVFPFILDDRAAHYYITYIGPHATWQEMYDKLDHHFNTMHQNQYSLDLSHTTLRGVKAANRDKTLLEAFDIMIDKSTASGESDAPMKRY